WSYAKPLRAPDLIPDSGRHLRLRLRRSWRGECEIVDDGSPAEAKPVIRRDLDRAAASEQVVPAANGRHLDAALVDFVHRVGACPSAAGAPAAEQASDCR